MSYWWKKNDTPKLWHLPSCNWVALKSWSCVVGWRAGTSRKNLPRRWHPTSWVPLHPQGLLPSRTGCSAHQGITQRGRKGSQIQSCLTWRSGLLIWVSNSQLIHRIRPMRELGIPEQPKGTAFRYQASAIFLHILLHSHAPSLSGNMKVKKETYS